MNHLILRLLRHKTIRAFWHIFIYVITLPLYFIGFIIPKNRALWVFSNAFGYKDNARYLFEYVREHHPEIAPIWISKNKYNSVEIDTCHSHLSLMGIWLQYRAGVFFVSTGLGDLARFTLAGTKVIQLWHGIPIKRILLDSPESLPFGKRSGIIRTFSLKVFQKSLRRYAVVIASSETVQRRLASAFGLPDDRIQITGYPRHDILFENSKSIKKQILYAPTWRSDIRNAFTIVHAVCNPEFVSKIEELGYELWVSIHPLNRELMMMLDSDVLDSIKLIKDEDVNIILAHSEILITDYSSIALDFAMLRRKIIFYTPDAYEYLDSRGVYEEFESLILEQGVKNVDDIFSHILDKKSVLSPAFSDIFFQYHDSGARERIVNLAKKWVNCF